VNTVRYFYGKLHPWHEFEDLLQEAYIVFMRCKHMYGHVVDNPRWFMALFSRSLHNRMINLVQHGPRYNFTEDLVSSGKMITQSQSENDGYLFRLLDQMPVELLLLCEDAVWSNSVKFKRAARKHLEEWFKFAGEPSNPNVCEHSEVIST